MKLQTFVLLIVSAAGLVSLTRAQASTKQESLVGLPVTLKCQMQNGGEECSWKRWRKLEPNLNVATNATGLQPPGYKIIGDYRAGNCDLVIESVKVADEADWACTIPNNGPSSDVIVELVIIVPPQSVHLEYNGTQLTPGEFKVAFVQNEFGEVAVDCLSERSRPAPLSLEWHVNGQKILHNHTQNETHVHKDDETVTVRSTILIQFPIPTKTNPLFYRYEPDPKYEKEVMCTVKHNKFQDSVSVSATFGYKYATSAVHLTEYPITNDPTKIFLFCQANGIPKPRLRIQKISSWTIIPYKSTFEGEENGGIVGENRTTSERGTYICRATYEGVRLDVISNFVRLKFGVEEDPTPVPYTNSKATKDPNGAAVKPGRTKYDGIFICFTIAAILILS